MELTDARYQELLSAENENRTLKATAENTKEGLSANRAEISKLKEQISTLETNVTEKDTELEAKVKEIEEKKTELEEAKELGTKWTEFEEKTKEELKTNIEELKTNLGEKLTDDHKTFIEGLPDDKVQSFLKTLQPDNKKAPNLKEGEGGDDAGTKDPSKFDSAAADGNLDAMMSALNE